MTTMRVLRAVWLTAVVSAAAQTDPQTLIITPQQAPGVLLSRRATPGADHNPTRRKTGSCKPELNEAATRRRVLRMRLEVSDFAQIRGSRSRNRSIGRGSRCSAITPGVRS